VRVDLAALTVDIEPSKASALLLRNASNRAGYSAALA